MTRCVGLKPLGRFKSFRGVSLSLKLGDLAYPVVLTLKGGTGDIETITVASDTDFESAFDSLIEGSIIEGSAFEVLVQEQIFGTD